MIVATGGITLKVISCEETHLWEDSLHFIKEAIRRENSSEKWYMGTYSRGSILCSVTAFEI
ncbi:MAG: hypothetical protein IJF43_03820 [Firmicutes bacterium]|nr:hypothetical protein [Bacillota bacterium]